MQLRVGPVHDPDRYRLVDRHSRGGEGELWRAELRIGQVPIPVAVKVAHPAPEPGVRDQRSGDGHATSSPSSQPPRSLVRWEQQTELLRTLDHPNLVRVREVFEGPAPHPPAAADAAVAEPRLFLVMNWVEGPTIARWAEEHAPGPTGLLATLQGVAEALDYLHVGADTAGTPVLHRDVKPANVLVTGSGARLVDFGLARLLDATEGSMTMAGTPAFLAPEVITDERFSTASDRYAFAATVYQLLTGAKPNVFTPARMRERMQQVMAGDTDRFADLLLAGMHLDPQRRPDNLAAWLEEVAAVCPSEVRSTTPAGTEGAVDETGTETDTVARERDTDDPPPRPGPVATPAGADTGRNPRRESAEGRSGSPPGHADADADGSSDTVHRPQSRDGPAEPTAPPQLASSTTAGTPRTGRGRRRMLGAAAVVAVLLIGIGAFWQGPGALPSEVMAALRSGDTAQDADHGSAPDTTQPTAPGPASREATEPEQDPPEGGEQPGAPTPPEEHRTWERIALDEEVFRDGVATSVVRGGPGLVAIGGDMERDAGAVWTSTDGHSWERVPHDEEVFGGTGSQMMLDVVAADGALVAVGADLGRRSGAVWTSTDGHSWERISPEDEAFSSAVDETILGSSVTATDTGLVAVGEDLRGGSGVVWTSTDGGSWERVSLDEEVFGDAQAVSVVDTGAGLVAVGRDLDRDAGAVWTSAGSHTWQRVPHDEDVFGGTGKQSIDSVVDTDAGLVAVGHDDGRAAAAVWTSTGGHTWQRVPHDEDVFGGTGEQSIDSVVDTDAGLVAVGRDDGRAAAAVWTSTDGNTWQRVPHDEEVFAGAGMLAMWSAVDTDTGPVAVGLDGGRESVAVWRAR